MHKVWSDWCVHNMPLSSSDLEMKAHSKWLLRAGYVGGWSRFTGNGTPSPNIVLHTKDQVCGGGWLASASPPPSSCFLVSNSRHVDLSCSWSCDWAFSVLTNTSMQKRGIPRYPNVVADDQFIIVGNAQLGHANLISCSMDPTDPIFCWSPQEVKV